MSELEMVFHEKRESLFLTALRIVKNPEDAEEAVQDGFMKAHTGFGAFEGRSKISTWVHKIVIRAALMKLRSNSGGPLAPHRRDGDVEFLNHLHSSSPNPEHICRGIEVGSKIEEAVEELSPALKEAFTMFFVQGMTVRESTELLGIGKNAFKARVFRARQLLRERLIEIRN